MSKKIAINGFGRIGRLVTRALLKKMPKDVEIVAINDLTDNPTLAHLFKYDTAHGIFQGDVSADANSITIKGKKIHAYAEKDPSKLPWKELGVDIVIECTGRFTKREDAELHLKAGAKKVLISAPGKGNIKYIVLGINDHELTADDIVVSNASCTTNCLAPMVKVLHENFGIVEGLFTTVHAYTADQSLQDSPHKDLRRARAAAANIVPTTTGAAEAVGIAIPAVKGKLTGVATRVPIITGSLTDLNVVLAKPATVAQINEAFRKAAAKGSLKGIMEYSTDPLVSSDIVGNTHSCIFDSDMTIVLGSMAKITGWYDNEAGYSTRLAELTFKMLSL
ncbi:MAG: type I glyceraldehyde-3-phosphate dehydrogenase [Chitinophagales bacterium]|jgi:glyceraldehyde 3-phosphate dehydrogenase|nr:type I glyceraldehyde-3-phosphate dehydrogenase [Chitinophagales bacterium]HNI44976.1 type I glyceraldehyde-3-phosphate dehydrogenase [Chitinophagales bacterium]HNL06781.1 type I glyceraldehyde-3-phosphate dehydrogenase [Chitinophagales bacterium]